MASRGVRESAVHELVGFAYEAALGPSGWSDWLRALARATSAEMPGLSVHPTAGGCASAISLDCDPRFLVGFEQHYGAVLADAVARVGRREGTLALRETAPGGELERWEYYADWVRPQGFRDAIAYVAKASPYGSFGFGVFRKQGQRDFGSAEIRLLERVGPHFLRAYQLQQRVGRLAAEGDEATAVLEHLAVGVVLVDAGGGLLFANAAAEAIAAREEGLALDRCGLRPSSPSVERALGRSVRDALATARGTGLAPGRAIAAPRGPQRRPLELLVTPLPTIAVGARTAAAAIFVWDPEDRSPPAADSLQQLLGLTAAEARVAAALGVGYSLEEAAQQLAITRETARNHLKQIFERTGTHRQAELVALLQGIDPSLRAWRSDPNRVPE